TFGSTDNDECAGAVRIARQDAKTNTLHRAPCVHMLLKNSILTIYDALDVQLILTSIDAASK
ncbi:hypothetical protein, partial [Salmonella enterica]|uniref:hypothetical protein n=1 Tax=Salmonella enterica TaxID=28901 RepID=UPI003524245F